MTVDVIQGDCRDMLATAPDESFDCIMADPPYGDTSLAWDRWPPGWTAAARRVLKKTGSMWVFGSMRMFLDRAGEFAGWKLAQDIIWEKHNGSGFLADRFKRVHENAIQFYRDDAPWESVYKLPQYTNDAAKRTTRRKGGAFQHMRYIAENEYRSEAGGPRLMRSVIFARSEHMRADHPTQKPIAIVEPLLLYACPKGGTVLDPFSGSGTTGLVAQRHGMHAVLIEADPTYAELSRRRVTGELVFTEAT